MSPDKSIKTPIEDGKSIGSGTGGDRAYFVEARFNYHEPCEICGQLMDKEWRRIHFSKGPIGIPGPQFPNLASTNLGLHSYAQAEALRWWFLAAADTNHDTLCLETRLVEVEVNWTFNSKLINYLSEADYHGPIVENLRNERK